MINNILQFAIVTPNADNTIEDLQKTLNLGPMKVWDFKYPSLFDTKINSQNKEWSMKLAFGWIGDMQFEIIEPTGGNSLYKSFLGNRNQAGIQHLLMDRGKKSYEETRKELGNMGYSLYNEAKSNVAVQIGPLKLPPLPMWLARSSATTFGYTDTLESMKVVLEISKYPPGIKPRQGIRMGVPSYWAGKDKTHFEKLPGNSVIKSVEGFIVLVRELKAAKSHYDAIFAGSEHLEREDSVIYSLDRARLALVQVQPGTAYEIIVNKGGEGARILEVQLRDDNIGALIAKGFEVLDNTNESLLIGHKDLPFYMETNKSREERE